jgi:hypothetical protein
MRQRSSLALVLACLTALGVTLLAANSAVGNHKRSACYPRNSVTLARDSTGRLYDDGTNYFGCLYHHGKRVPLTNDETVGPGEIEAKTSDAGNQAPMAIAGRYAAFVVDDCDIVGCGTGVSVFDLRGEQNLYSAGTGENSCTEYDCQEGQLTDLVLKRNGSAAWIVCPRRAHGERRCGRREFEVWRLDSRSDIDSNWRTTNHRYPKLLDSGADIDRHSLELTKSRKGITWIKAGKRYGASLR